MKCPSCGYENSDDVVSCNLCQFVLKKETQPNIVETPEDFSSQQLQPNKSIFQTLLKNKWVIIPILLIILYVYGRNGYGKQNLKIEGSRVTVTNRHHNVIMQRELESKDYSFLVVGKVVDLTNYPLRMFPIIPMESVEALTKQYGDFRKCNSPGAEASKGSAFTIALLGINPQIEKEILMAAEKAKEMRDFVIKIKAAKLSIVKSTYEAFGIKGESNPFPEGEKGEQYLVEEISVTDSE